MSETVKKKTPDSPPPMVVVDLGKRQTRKRVKRLRKGKGKLMGKVSDLVADLREEGAIEANAQAVVIVVRQKNRKFKYGM